MSSSFKPSPVILSIWTYIIKIFARPYFYTFVMLHIHIYIDRERLVHKSVYWQPLNCNFIYHWMAAAWQKRWYGDRKEEREKNTRTTHMNYWFIFHYAVVHTFCVYMDRSFSAPKQLWRNVCVLRCIRHIASELLGWPMLAKCNGCCARFLFVSFFIYYFSISVNGCCTRYRAHQFSNGRHDQLRCVWMEWNCEKSPELCT